MMSGTAGSAEAIVRWAAQEVIRLHREPTNDAPPGEKRSGGGCTKCRRRGCLLLFWAQVTVYLITPGNVSNEPVNESRRAIRQWTGTEYPDLRPTLLKMFSNLAKHLGTGDQAVRNWEAGEAGCRVVNKPDADGTNPEAGHAV